MLNDKQLQAIDELVAGRKRNEIEASVGISHAQLNRWTHEPSFIQRWETERAVAHERRMDKLWLAGDRALDVLIDSLEEGDPKTAMDLLKLLAPGLIDVRRVREDRTAAKGLASGMPGIVEAAEHRCRSCGKEFKSAGALGSHDRTHKPVGAQV
jgi:hypothetical protein